MYKYEVGQIIPAFMGHAENVYFNMDNGGATMFVFFQSPTMKEIEQFKSGKEFQIRFVELYDVIMLMAKIGDLDWMDAPYTPHLFPVCNPNRRTGIRANINFSRRYNWTN